MEESWNSRCIKSIQKEEAEIEKRYGIRFGQTEIYCIRCGRNASHYRQDALGRDFIPFHISFSLASGRLSRSL